MDTQNRAQIGPYLIETLLGKGSMGLIYAGRHVETGTTAAIKTVSTIEAAKLGQIRKEIRSLARLHHPGVVQILEHGIDGGKPWYAMELLQGTTLDSLVRQKRPEHSSTQLASATPVSVSGDDDATLISDLRPLAERHVLRGSTPAAEKYQSSQHDDDKGLNDLLALGSRICRTLAYVHGEGIIHRDLKPGNIFIKNGVDPILVDFGLGSQMNDESGREVVESALGISGSPNYMAPEQIRGEALDARCDLYAFGCILYRLVTGKTPFSGSRAQVLRGHLERDPVRPSDLASDVPAELDELILSLMAKSRDSRIGYAENVALALEEMGGLPNSQDFAVNQPSPYLYKASFVASGKVIERCSKHIETACKGKGQFIVLSGESGSGKTRHAMELARRAKRSDMRIINGQCHSGLFDGGQMKVQAHRPLHPFQPLFDAFADLCSEQPGFLKTSVEERDAAVLAEYSESIASLPDVAGLTAPPQIGEDDARRRLYRAVAKLITACGGAQPLFLLIDDIQWADELSLGMLSYLADGHLADMKGLVVGTVRSEEQSAPVKTLLSLPEIEEISLARMGSEEVTAMTGGMLAINPVPAAFARFLLERSNGNPFFIAEYLRSAVQEKVLVRNLRGEWLFSGSGMSDERQYEALDLPQSLRALIELRLNRTAPVARSALDCAALIGRDFDPDLISRIEQVDGPTMLSIIDELVSQQVLEHSATGGLRFLHDKIREIAEASLPAARLRERHLQIAQALEGVTEADRMPPDNPGQLGHHWSAAGIPEKAVPYLGQAGAQAKKAHAIEEAIQFYETADTEIGKARQSADPEPGSWAKETVEVNEALGELLLLKRLHNRSRQRFETALQSATDNPLSQCRLLRKVAKAWEGEHNHDEALAAYSGAEAELARVSNNLKAWQNEQIEIRLGRLWIYYWSAQTEAIEAELAGTRQLIERHGTADHRYGFYFSQILNSLRKGRYRVGVDLLQLGEALLAAALDRKSEAEIAFAHFELGFLRLFAGRLEEAKPEFLTAISLYQEIGDAGGETRSLCYYVILLRRLQQIEATRNAAQDLLRQASDGEMIDYIGIAHASLAWTDMKHGDVKHAELELARAFEVWNSLSYVYSMQWTAALVSLQIAYENKQYDKLSQMAKTLIDPIQLHLPDAIDGPMRQIVQAAERDDTALMMSSAKRALDQSVSAGFL
ncbi:hypothetical protein E1180_12860 [Roseibium denhamense]|uniref:Predicted ATPase n=1 Tax=Roseibium denhamense TaxID=76305 RepID=A0ABY1NH07_9HYPH|nr:serine/threonine-protein kinase [Roseibium denhamense]MTI06407.1 hypothetical protein [Roseibium denhamense]SMP08903.1 Predicted ATPase [Roseibium denhamense]